MNQDRCSYSRTKTKFPYFRMNVRNIPTLNFPNFANYKLLLSKSSNLCNRIYNSLQIDDHSKSKIYPSFTIAITRIKTRALITLDTLRSEQQCHKKKAKYSKNTKTSLVYTSHFHFKRKPTILTLEAL